MASTRSLSGKVRGPSSPHHARSASDSEDQRWLMFGKIVDPAETYALRIPAALPLF